MRTFITHTRIRSKSDRHVNFSLLLYLAAYQSID